MDSSANQASLPNMTFTFGCDCCGSTGAGGLNQHVRDKSFETMVKDQNSPALDLYKREEVKKSISNVTLSTYLTDLSSKDEVGSLDDSSACEDYLEVEESASASEHPNTTFETVSFHRFRAEMSSTVFVERGALSSERLPLYARTFIPSKCHNSNIFVVTDSIVDPLLGKSVAKSLEQAGLSVFKIVVPAEKEDVSSESSGERFKTFQTLSDVCNQVILTGLDKNSCIVSLGGGVVNNLCGVVASMIYRGISLVHFPTTTMAQADAAIDFKQAVNHPLGKNLLGTYYPATNIVCDPDVLSTLSKRHVLNGLSECIKHGICHDKIMVDLILDACSEGEDSALDTSVLETVVKRTIALKAETLTDYDNSDFNEMAPQYGHAIGHAVEHLSWKMAEVRPLLHGESCAIGMCVSAEIAHLLGYCDKETVDDHYNIFKAVGLPCIVPEDLEIADIMACLTYDKHFVKKPTMGLVHAIGDMKVNDEQECYTFSIDPKIVKKALTINQRLNRITVP